MPRRTSVKQQELSQPPPQARMDLKSNHNERQFHERLQDHQGGCPAVSMHIPCPSANQLVGPRPGEPMKQHQERLLYVDWIRAFVVALVVTFHSIDLFFDYTYSAAVYLGIVNTLPADASRQVAIVLAQLMQSWFMGLMFLLSGYFSRPSYNKKGPVHFLADRALRLLLPLLVYDCLVQPLAFEIARHSSAAPADLRAAHDGFTYYYNTQFVRLGHGAGWFICVLFIFDLVYAAVRVCIDGGSRVISTAVRAAKAATAEPLPCGKAVQDTGDQAGMQQQDCGCSTYGTAAASIAKAARQPDAQLVLPVSVPWPSLRLPQGAQFSTMVTFAGVVGIGTLTAGLCLLARMGVLLPLGLPQSLWVVRAVQFQPAYLPQYVVAFCLGVAAHRVGNGLQRLPSDAGCIAVGAAAVLAAGGGVLMSRSPGSNFGHELVCEPSMSYVAAFTVWEQFYAVTIWLAVIICFRQLANREGGRAGRAVSGAAYSVYLIHVPMLTVYGLAFLPVAWPAAVKCLLVTPLVVVSSWLVGMLLKMIPGVKRVL